MRFSKTDARTSLKIQKDTVDLVRELTLPLCEPIVRQVLAMAEGATSYGGCAFAQGKGSHGRWLNFQYV